MNLRFHADVYKQLQQLPRSVFPGVLDAVLGLIKNPRPTGCKKLVGGGGNDWRIRMGEYRVVYEIADQEEVVTVMRIAHRRDVYR